MEPVPALSLPSLPGRGAGGEDPELAENSAGNLIVGSGVALQN